MQAQNIEGADTIRARVRSTLAPAAQDLTLGSCALCGAAPVAGELLELGCMGACEHAQRRQNRPSREARGGADGVWRRWHRASFASRVGAGRHAAAGLQQRRAQRVLRAGSTRVRGCCVGVHVQSAAAS